MLGSYEHENIKDISDLASAAAAAAAAAVTIIVKVSYKISVNIFLSKLLKSKSAIFNISYLIWIPYALIKLITWLYC